MLATPDTASPALPPLRDELQLLDGNPAADGAPTWLIHDPVRHRYFHIGRVAFELLSRWQLADPDAVVQAVNNQTTCRVQRAELDQFVTFLNENNLLRGDHPGVAALYSRQAAARRQSVWQSALHNYLFFRIPLVRPDRFLGRTLALVEPLFSPVFVWGVLLAGLLGLLLVVRQWDQFLHTFAHFFSLEGLAWYFLALAGVKIAHELGHAYTAKRFGCRVPTMGIALLVMWPVLYTDTTDAWRLTGRRRRLAIGAAGMGIELAIAAIATLAWSFLPDGPVRSAAFFVATTSWVMTLAVNLNPFMRFDGYYLLSDLIGVHNLQERSFALGRWSLRELLFGLREAPPERFEPRLQRLLILYAWGTWLYRLLLFIGIALLVYHFFFKLLGVLLFVVEIVWFIARPIWRELQAWRTLGDRLRVSRNLVVSGLLSCAALAIVATPWSTRVAVPAVLRTAQQVDLYASAPARITAIHVRDGQAVAAGELLFELESPELNHELAQTERRVRLLNQEIERQSATVDRLDNIAVLHQELARERSALRGHAERRSQLQVTAAFAGRVVDLPGDLHAGRWINERLRLGRIVIDDAAQLLGYVESREADRLKHHALARFYPDNPELPPVDCEVSRVDGVNVRALDLPYLASRFDGPIAVREQADQLIPESSFYRVLLTPQSLPFAPRQVVRGTVHVEGEARSLVGRAWRSVAAVLIRESGF